jgi:hypothetical protein
VPLVENTSTRMSFVVPDISAATIALWFSPHGAPEYLIDDDFIVKPTISSATQYPVRNGKIRVKGSGFATTSKILLGGNQLTTTYIDTHTLEAKVPANYPLGIDAIRIYTRLADMSDNCGPIVLESFSLDYNVKVSPLLTPAISLLLQ